MIHSKDTYHHVWRLINNKHNQPQRLKSNQVSTTNITNSNLSRVTKYQYISLINNQTRNINHGVFFVVVCFEVEISLHTPIPLFTLGAVHSGSASWDDSSRMCLDMLHVSSFPDRFPHYASTAAWSAHSDFVGSRLYACLGVACHVHFWQNDHGLLCATAVTRGWNRHWIRVSTQS